MNIDDIQLNFSPDDLQILNICLGFIMFGIALGLKPDHFKRVLKYPKATLTGLFSQLILLPALTLIIAYIFQPSPSIVLGMILISVCPGGATSNFMVSFAKGNTALSVSLTAITTLSSIVITPFNFAFWGSLYPEVTPLLQDIQLDIWDMCKTVLLILGFPLILGMWVGHRFPDFTKKITKHINRASILFFTIFIFILIGKNINYLIDYIYMVAFLVFVHNGLALLSGYNFAKLVGLNNVDARSISIETGIQNTGLGLVLIFNFFDGLGGMAMVMAWWGTWHLMSGLLLALYWNKTVVES